VEAITILGRGLRCEHGAAVLQRTERHQLLTDRLHVRTLKVCSACRFDTGFSSDL
jgi:hypothetical protein